MSRFVTALVGRSPKTWGYVRSIGMRPLFCQGVSVHPERRRTLPLIYIDQDEEEPVPTPESRFNDWDQHRSRKLRDDWQRRRKDPCKNENPCFSDTYRWWELRRKIVYGRFI
ncbi:hypothetical protein KR018_008104 [Drosophila ironensis]|nr:hypothetical protein KR018_008104 [Drosophila ironensis]